MPEDNSKIEALSQRLDKLLAMHNDVSFEIDNLRVEILRLKVEAKQTQSESEPSNLESIPETQQDTDSALDTSSLDSPAEPAAFEEVTAQAITQNEDIPKTQLHTNTTAAASDPPPKKKFDIEKLIGENLINKIGILILIIGVGIGAKYSIDNELISPLTRIVLGYLTGVVLLGLSMYLKKNYLNFSAVILSGAMAILYFITFFAFDFYQLMGQEIAFGLMVIFTIFTVLAALNYDKEIIAHLGLIGAISVPFLLSNDAGNVVFLFSYLALVNVAIAFISLKKNWKILFYSAFVLTWVIFFTWMGFEYEKDAHFGVAFGFLTLFFVLFYVIFIAYKFINLKKYDIADVVVLLLNSVIFFGIGYALITDHEVGNQMPGLFALFNALVHFVAAFLIHQRKLADKNLFYLVVGLVLSCLTLAIPIQLEGKWIAMLWAAEALILFFIGRKNNIPFYEYISYVLVALAGVSLLGIWATGYTHDSLGTAFSQYSSIKQNDFILNPMFLTSAVVMVCFGLITWLHLKKEWRQDIKLDKTILTALDFAIPIIFLITCLLSLWMEILNYFDTSFLLSELKPDGPNAIYNYNYEYKGRVWLINYCMLFFSVLTYFLYKKVSNKTATWILIGFNVLFILNFLISGLFNLSELRENYLSPQYPAYYNLDHSFLWLRYLSIALLGILTYGTMMLTRKVSLKYTVKIIAEVALCLIILWVTTSELIHWLDYNDNSENYGLALSIFWGIFSVAIVALGIWKKKKHLRILGITIIVITVIKLFVFDLSGLSTISKTIVMISLGALLLLTSFLYNKYTIEDEEQA